jgi:hypothetical protein
MSRRRGNPNWGKPILPVPATATEFDREVRRLGLKREDCVHSTELREWCRRNRNQCYIPEWLLAAWGIDVDSLSVSKSRTFGFTSQICQL